MRFKWIIPAVILLGVLNFFRPLPQPKPIYDLRPPAATKAIQISWPEAKQAAVGAVDYDLFDAKPTDEGIPTASVAKVMTALVVLKQKPLMPGQAGPAIVFNGKDVATYRKYLAQNGSVVPIAVGEKLTELQALRAMLVPSGNNIADKLAAWAYGSMTAYVRTANQVAKELGMNGTIISDASGFNPKTTSTAHDLVILGLAAMKQSVIAGVVRQKTVKLPVVGMINSTNWLLGKNGVIGIKTGHTDQSGGVYLFASRQKIKSQPITLVGSIAGAKDSLSAISATPQMIEIAKHGLESTVIVNTGQLVAHYDMAWGDRVDVVAAKTLKILNWRGQQIENEINLQGLKITSASGAQQGELIARGRGHPNSVKLILASDVQKPSFFWRLFRL